MDRFEKSYKNQAFICSLVFHSLLFVLFFLFILNTPDPPLSEGGSGIELNYGTYDEGSGELQTLHDASDNQDPENTVKEEVAEAIIPPTPTPAPAEEVPAPSEEKEMLTSEEPEDFKIETKKEDIPKEEKKTLKVPDLTPAKPVVEKPVTAVKPPEPEKPVEPVKEKPIVVEKKETATPVTASKSGDMTTKGGNNNGDREGKVGDQGNPEGSLNAKALYGNPGEGGDGSGGSGGNKLDLTGWKLAFKLEKKDVTNENGKIVYQIKVDKSGELVSIIPIEKTVSPAVEKFYRQQIEDNWAVDRTKDNTNPPPLATGRYTVFVRSK